MHRLRLIFTLAAFALLASACQEYGKPSYESSVPTRRPEPRFVVTIVASEFLRAFRATPTGQQKTSADTGWPMENLVLTEQELIYANWATKELVFELSDPAVFRDLALGGNHFAISYNGEEVTSGSIHWIVPASGIVDGPVMFIEYREPNEAYIEVVLLEDYDMRRLPEMHYLSVGDATLDEDIGSYLAEVLSER